MTSIRFATASLALTALLVVAGCASESTQTSKASAYSAVIDAGSSGSRIYLYEGRSKNGELEVNTLLEFEPDDATGLSSFIDQPQTAGENGVAPLIVELEKALKTEGINPADVPVSVLATAGMRNAERANPEAAAAIYDDVTAYIEEQGFTVAEAATISGMREAVYSWADVNFSSGVFAGGTDPVGIVELGGASSQIAFPTKSTSENAVTLKISGTSYTVFGVSFLGMGVNDAREGIITEADATAGSPCFPNNADGAEPVAYDKKNSVPVAAATSVFDFTSCTNRYSTYLANTGQLRVNLDNSGGLTPQQIASVDGFSTTNFLGLAAINYAMQDFDIASQADESLALTDTINQVCAGDDAWGKVSELFAGEISAFSENACANGTYAHTWVFSPNGLGINPDQLTVAGEVGQNSPTWTRGFVVLQLTGNTVS